MKKLLFTTALLLAAGPALCQNLPHVGYVYPAGGQRGSRFEVTIGGQFLGGTTNIYVTGGGVTARVENYERPISQKEFNELRTQIEELRKKRETNRSKRAKGQGATWNAADEKLYNEVRAKVAKFQRRPPNPSIAETVTLSLTISPEAAVGTRELRLRNVLGLSNPMVFQVGQLPELAEKPEHTMEERPTPKRYTPQAARETNPAEMKASVPVIVNGQIMAGDVDRVKFRARQGQQLVIAVRARELVPYIPDAVPGWFQATLALFDAKGSELAYDDDFRFSPDPVLFFKVPKDGEYVAELKDSIFRGREDFVYRLEIGEFPFVTGVFPLGAQAGARTVVQAAGWNLPEQTLEAPASGDSACVQFLQARKGDAASNLIPFERCESPESLEQEPNNAPASAQKLSVPIVVNGRIAGADDKDVFKFQGKAGMKIVAEVSARRLNSPLDSTLRLIGPDGKQVAFNDDFEDKSAGLTTHQADSMITTNLPADGTYTLELCDAQRKGGQEYAYRLRVSEPQPGFELRMVPSSLTLRAGGTAPVTVYALRKDGFTGEIMLSVDSEDHGLALSGARIPANQDQVRMTITAPADSAMEPFAVKLSGSGIVGGKVVSKPIVPAEDMMQAFFYRHLVPSKELVVWVNNGFPQRMPPIKVVSELPVKIPCGGTATVRFGGGKWVSERLKLELSEPPEGITIGKLGTSKFGSELVLACDKQAKPGTRGNLILEPSFNRPQTTTKKNAPSGGKSNTIGCLPAIPFEIVAAGK